MLRPFEKCPKKAVEALRGNRRKRKKWRGAGGLWYNISTWCTPAAMGAGFERQMCPAVNTKGTCGRKLGLYGVWGKPLRIKGAGGMCHGTCETHFARAGDFCAGKPWPAGTAVPAARHGALAFAFGAFGLLCVVSCLPAACKRGAAAAACHDRWVRAAFGLFFDACGGNRVLYCAAVHGNAACAGPVFCTAVGGPCGKPAGVPSAGGRAAGKRLFPCGVHIKASAGGVARAAAVFVVAALFQHLFIFPCAENRAQGILFRACTAGGRGGPY